MSHRPAWLRRRLADQVRRDSGDRRPRFAAVSLFSHPEFERFTPGCEVCGWYGGVRSWAAAEVDCLLHNLERHGRVC